MDLVEHLAMMPLLRLSILVMAFDDQISCEGVVIDVGIKEEGLLVPDVDHSLHVLRTLPSAPCRAWWLEDSHAALHAATWP